MTQDSSKLPHPLPCLLRHVQTVINVHHKPVIWFLGGPGCGKGTQCALLTKKYGFTHLSTGELLRAEVEHGGEKAEYLHNIMVQGGLVPSDTVLYLLREEMERLEPTSKGFLIDGYPREKDQAVSFELVISSVSLVIYLEASMETMLKRLKGRAAAAANARLDDTEDVFHKRIDMFLSLNNHILNLYADKLLTINAEGSTDKIFKEIQKHVDPLVKDAEKYAGTHKGAKVAPAGS